MLDVRSVNPFQAAELAQLQAEQNWPRAVHTDGDDAYRSAPQSNRAGLVPVYCSRTVNVRYLARHCIRQRNITDYARFCGMILRI